MPGTLILDCEGLSKLSRKDSAVTALIQVAAEDGTRVATSATTTLEADDARIHPARIKWVLSRIDVHDVTRTVADQAAVLLRDRGLRGHKYTIDAVLAAVARAAMQPVSVLTSDPEDLTLLCGGDVQVIKV